MRDKEFFEERFVPSSFGPTRSSGVYAICVFDPFDVHNKTIRVVYIGSAKNINKRVLNPMHIYRRLNNILKSLWTTCLYFECDNYVEVEKYLIRKYKPRFNRHLYGAN